MAVAEVHPLADLKVDRGQVLVGQLEPGENRIFVVSGISRLQTGDTKAWLLTWDPKKGPEEHTRKFVKGELDHPWRVLDLYDPAALLDRAERAVTLHKSRSEQEIALQVLRAMFKGAE